MCVYVYVYVYVCVCVCVCVLVDVRIRALTDEDITLIDGKKNYWKKP